jgi:ActR/RegA family two-component response regulator/MinD-like ATPase involved in chromosome partitioning or flagellar assembly
MLNAKRILIIEDDEDYKRLLSAVLARAGESFEVKTARTLAEGLVWLRTFYPEIILVDLNLPDSAGYETFLRVHQQAGDVPIVVLAGLDDDSTAVQAIKDGAQDYLVKSLIQPKLIVRSMNMIFERLSRQAADHETAPARPGTVIGFIGSKGGVGTSTTAVNIAAVLVQNGWDTVAIELQPGPGTLSLYTQSEPVEGMDALLGKAADTITALDVERHLVEAVRGLRVLSPSGSPGIRPPIGGEHVHAIVSAARKASPYVVLDLPPRIDEGVVEALKLCDCMALVVDREPASVRSGAAMLNQIESIVSPALGVRRVVVDRTVLDEPLPMADIQYLLKLQPAVVVPQAASAIARSHWVKTPLMFLHPDELFRLAHLELAQHLLARCVRAGAVVADHAGLPNGRSYRSVIPETTYG